jgi:predicted HD superfamily hydrolase involved in NAD metabolism
VPIIETARAKEFVSLLRARVSDHTLRHCIFAAEYMASFAAQAEISNDEAVAAGLLHDLCKGMADAELLAAANEHGIVLNDTQRLKPGLLHGPVAAEECRRDLGIADQAVYDAIYWHSTGHPEWGKVGLALYVADFAEPSRTFSEAQEARRILRREGFTPALRYVSARKLEHVRTKLHVDPTTEAFHAWLTTDLER